MSRRLLLAVTAGLPATAAAVAIAAAQSPSDYTLPTAAPEPRPSPQLGESVVIRLTGGRVTYRPVGVARSRRLTGAPVELRFGARVDATRGRVRVTIARNRAGATSSATFYDGVFRVAEQETQAPYVATLRLAGTSFDDACGEPTAGTARAAARRSSRRVRRLWGNGKGRFRTRGRYSAATVRGTWWLTEDRCDGTVTRVRRGEVIVEDFTQTEPAPAPQVPTTGGGEDGAGAPAPQTMRTPKRKRVRVRSGGSYTARPQG